MQPSSTRAWRARPAAWLAPLAVLLPAALCLPAAARAAAFSIVTTGTISSGTDPLNILGAGTSLASDAYTLTVATSGLGAGYSTTGSNATDSTQTLPGSVTLTVAGHTLVTSTLSAITFYAQEDTFGDVNTVASGLNAAGGSVFASQTIDAGTGFLSAATLQTAFSYTLAPSDYGADTYSFSNAANTGSVSFNGTPATVALVLPAATPVPEPASWAMLGAGLLGLAVARAARSGRALDGTYAAA